VDVKDPKGKLFFALNHHFLVGLNGYLQSRHGRGRSEEEACQICTKVSKYLLYADKTHLQEGMLLNAAIYNGHVPITFGG